MVVVAGLEVQYHHGSKVSNNLVIVKHKEIFLNDSIEVSAVLLTKQQDLVNSYVSNISTSRSVEFQLLLY